MRHKNWLFIFTAFLLHFSNSLHADVDWSPTSTLSEVGDIFLPKIAFNDSGQGVAIWEATNNTGLSLFYSLYQEGEWGTNQILTEARAVTGLSVAIDAKGHAVATWQIVTDDLLHSIIQAAAFNGKKWGPIKQLAIDGFNALSWPKVVMNKSGLALVAWGAEEGTLSACFFDKNQWTTSFDLTNSINPQLQTFDLAIHDNGKALAAWIDIQGIVQAKFHNGSNWSLITNNLSKTNALNSASIIAKISKLDCPLVTWVAEGEHVNTLECAYFDQFTWTSPQTIGSFESADKFVQFSLDMNAKGNAIALWGSSDGVLKAAHFKDKKWSDETIQSTNFSSQVGGVQVSLNNLEKAEAMWTENVYSLITNSYDGTNWSNAPTALTSNLKLQSPGTLALNNSNQILALWINGESFQGNNIVQSATAEKAYLDEFSGIINLTTSHLSNPKDPSQVYNQIEWAPVPHPAVTKYAIYRNNFFIAEVSAANTSYADLFNRGAMVYRLDALDQNSQVIASGSIYSN